MRHDVIIAGAGIWGCSVARILAEAGKKILVLESRPVIGGNVRCETDENSGIEVHVYGSHIFHTHIPEVWEFVNRFVSFNGYQHKVLAKHNEKTYFLPLGLALINKFFDVELTPAEVPGFMSDPVRKQAIFDTFFRNYTSKQWGKAPEDIDPSIIQRVPVRTTFDINYFNDYHQGIPESGYNSLFERLLDHPNIELHCNTVCSLEDIKTAECPVFYSGPVDRLFGYKFGPLPWRTLRFETVRLAVADLQGTAVVNYVDADVPYTRQHEYKHYHPEQKEVMAHPETIICREYSATWNLGDEPYYPINNPESQALLKQYRIEAEQYPNLIIGGRLGLYQYFDMDKAMESAMHTAKDWLSKQI